MVLFVDTRPAAATTGPNRGDVVTIGPVAGGAYRSNPLRCVENYGIDMPTRIRATQRSNTSGAARDEARCGQAPNEGKSARNQAAPPCGALHLVQRAWSMQPPLQRAGDQAAAERCGSSW